MRFWRWWEAICAVLVVFGLGGGLLTLLVVEPAEMPRWLQLGAAGGVMSGVVALCVLAHVVDKPPQR